MTIDLATSSAESRPISGFPATVAALVRNQGLGGPETLRTTTYNVVSTGAGGRKEAVSLSEGIDRGLRSLPWLPVLCNMQDESLVALLGYRSAHEWGVGKDGIGKQGIAYRGNNQEAHLGKQRSISTTEYSRELWWGASLTGMVSDTQIPPTPLISNHNNFLRTIDAISPVLQVLSNNSILEN